MAANTDKTNYCMDHILISFVITFMLSILFTGLSKDDKICTPVPQSMTITQTGT